MIINTAQAVSLKEVGIDLREECFSHMWLAQRLVLHNSYIYCRPQEEQMQLVKKFWIGLSS
jgi:hypothetical protein